MDTLHVLSFKEHMVDFSGRPQIRYSTLIDQVVNRTRLDYALDRKVQQACHGRHSALSAAVCIFRCPYLSASEARAATCTCRWFGVVFRRHVRSKGNTIIGLQKHIVINIEPSLCVRPCRNKSYAAVQLEWRVNGFRR